MQLDLYRVKVFARYPIETLMHDELRRPEVLRSAVEGKKSTATQKGVSWRIGNVKRLDHAGFYFRLGRTTKAMVSVLNAAGDFVENEFDSAPYTHVFMDVELGVAAIARDTKVAPTTRNMADRLVAVLEANAPEEGLILRFAADPVTDPKNFLERLFAAYAIRSFSYSFQRPNPLDSDKDFIQPFERLVQAANGNGGKATVKGDALNVTPLEEITRSVASTGDNVEARVQPTPDSPTTEVYSLKGAFATLGMERPETPDDLAEALSRIRELYVKVRGNG